MENGMVVKKTSATERLADEINYYDEISKTNYSVYFARKIGSSFNEEDKTHNLLLEYYPFSNLNNFYSLPYNDKLNIVNAIKFILKEFRKVEADGDRLAKETMYVGKTFNEYQKLVDGFPFFSKLRSQKEITLNGKKYKNFEVISNQITLLINKLLINDDKLCVFHGDLCFGNILYAKDSEGAVILKLIDPRGRFGKRGIYGDPLYDLAKLSHSYNGKYEKIVSDEFSLDYFSDSFKLKVFKDKDVSGLFEKGLSKQTIKKIRLIEGLIFIGMCARHYDSLKRQKAMYLTGIKILNEVLND